MSSLSTSIGENVAGVETANKKLLDAELCLIVQKMITAFWVQQFLVATGCDICSNFKKFMDKFSNKKKAAQSSIGGTKDPKAAGSNKNSSSNGEKKKFTKKHKKWKMSLIKAACKSQSWHSIEKEHESIHSMHKTKEFRKWKTYETLKNDGGIN